MRRISLAPILAAALLFLLVAHHHPTGPAAAGPCSVCVHHATAEPGIAAESAAPETWTPLVSALVTSKADADGIAAITRGPPTL